MSLNSSPGILELKPLSKYILLRDSLLMIYPYFLYWVPPLRPLGADHHLLPFFPQGYFTNLVTFC